MSNETAAERLDAIEARTAELERLYVLERTSQESLTEESMVNVIRNLVDERVIAAHEKLLEARLRDEPLAPHPLEEAELAHWQKINAFTKKRLR
jgi:hypothetical protein